MAIAFSLRLYNPIPDIADYDDYAGNKVRSTTDDAVKSLRFYRFDYFAMNIR